jgi:hypothetical protein
MKKPPTHCSLSKITLALFATAALLTPTFLNASQMGWAKGGNWSDLNGNYETGLIVPCGLTSSSTAAQASAKADQIASDLSYVGGNFVRLGINPASVADATWWPVMQAYINELVAKGFNVDLCCWTAANDGGKIANVSAWTTMWQKVNSVYSGNWSIWYEPLNEPYGYTTESSLATSVYVPFLKAVSSKSQQRIILDGTGYSSGISAVGADPRFTTCALGAHDYGFWHTNYTTEAQWTTEYESEINGYQARTILTEVGAPANSGLNYGTSQNNCFVSSIRAIVPLSGANGIGVVYWPSHRDNDGYRLFVNTTSGTWENWSLMNELENNW